MSHEGAYLDKNTSGRGKHRTRKGRNNEVPPSTTYEPVTPSAPASPESVHFEMQFLSPDAMAFVRSIPLNINFADRDVPELTQEALREAGLTILDIDRKGGEHITLTDGKVTQRIPHAEAVDLLRSLVAIQDKDAEEQQRQWEAQRKTKVSGTESEAIVQEAHQSRIENKVEGVPVMIGYTNRNKLEAEDAGYAPLRGSGYKSPSTSDAVIKDPAERGADTTDVRNPFFAGVEDQDVPGKGVSSDDEPTISPTESSLNTPTPDVDPFDALNRDFGNAIHEGLPDDARKAMDDVREATSEQLKEYDTRFSKEFDISEGELRGIQGFENLSLSQQKLVFENLKEYAERGRDGYLGAVWSGIKGAFGNKGEGIPKKGSKGMKAYGEELKILIYNADKYGPKVHEEDGELRADFVGMQFDREHRKEQKAVVDALNHAAHVFARTPAVWQEDGNGVHAKDEWKVTTFFKEKVLRSESRQNYREFESRERAFEDAKRNFAVQLEATGVSQAEIIQKLIDIDAQVHNIRFVETNPEAVEAVGNIHDESMWRSIGSKMVQGSIYGSIGAVGRLAIGQATGFLGAPLASAALAGTRSWNKTAAEQRERDRQTRLGVDVDPKHKELLEKMKEAYRKNPTSSEYKEALKALNAHERKSTTLNVVPASQIVEISGEKRDVGITQKLENTLNEYQELRTKLESAKASGDTASSNELQKQLDRKTESLNARVIYSYDKLKLNRIQFGDKNSYAVNQAKFFETLAEAKLALAEQDTGGVTNEGHLEERLAKYLNYRESAISDRRHKEQFKKIAVASSTAAAFSLAGALAAEELKTSGVTEKLKSFKSWLYESGEVFSKGDEIKDSLGKLPAEGIENSDTPSSTLPENYEIKRGDTLIKIVRSDIGLKGPDGAPLSDGAVLRKLQELTPEELQKIGVRSGNIDLIYANEKLNLVELQEALTGPVEVPTEDVGDFNDAESEKTDPIDTPIRESEVLDPSRTVEGFSNGVSSGGETASESEKPTLNVDLITQKKAQILEQYFLKTNFNLKNWEGFIKQDPAEVYAKEHPMLRGENMVDKELARVQQIFVAVGKEPLKMKPVHNESVEKFMHRIFIEIAKRGTDADYPPKFRELLNAVHRDASFT